MAGLELILGIGIGYIAFTENGHEIGNKMADIAAKSIKKTISDSVGLIKKKPTNEETAEKNKNICGGDN